MALTTKFWDCPGILIFLFIVCIWGVAFVAQAQISPENSPSIRASKFMVYVEHTDSIGGIQYQVGTYNPDNSPKAHLPVYLRIASQGIERYYDLDTAYDPDLFTFPELTSDNLVVIKGRYIFYLYDNRTQTLSEKLQPGRDQYEGEDAISGLYGALTLFDQEQFLLGNVQGFGVFCYDISSPANPIEHIQYRVKKAGDSQPIYAFFHKTAADLWDVIVARPDPSSEKNIPGLFGRLKIVRYTAKGISAAPY